jgi:hypothetical protein
MTTIRDALKSARDSVASVPLVNWLLLGYIIPFLFFFVEGVFFDPSEAMKFRRYISILVPIGHDYRVITSAASAWVHSGVAPTTLYPPFTLLFFSFFSLFSESRGYKLLTLLILSSYILATLLLPQRLTRQKGISGLAMLIFMSGLGSYGLQFEIERGQWNLIAFALCLSAIFVFHEYPRRRWLAYLLFTISVQLKLYPAIFVLTLVDDWRDWRNNLRRLIGLGAANIAALFIFGVTPMLGMFGAQGGETLISAREYNLSIWSFASQTSQANAWMAEVGLIGLFVSCFLFILWKSYTNHQKGFSPQIFVACAIGSLILPPISYDYKLAFLPASIILFVPIALSFDQRGSKLWSTLLAFVFSLAYSSTMFAPTYKPQWLHNNLPALLIMLAIATVAAGASLPGTTDAASNTGLAEANNQGDVAAHELRG